MALSNFQKAISEITGRAGNAFVSSDGSTWYHLGIVKNASVKANPLVTEGDTTGRVFQYGFGIEVQMVLMQAAWVRMADIEDILTSSANGLYFKITDRPATTAGAGAANGIKFVNAIANAGPEFNFSDAESGWTIDIKGNCALDAFDSFTSAGGTLTFDL